MRTHQSPVAGYPPEAAAPNSFGDHGCDQDDFFDNAPVPLHWVGPDGTILRANQAELELLGYSRDEYVGRNIREFHADRHAIADILCRLGAGDTLKDYEARLRCKDGTIRHVLITSNVRWHNGTFLHTRCFTRDITDRRLSEQLRATTADYLEGLMEGFVAYDADWRMTYMNSAAERLLGRERGDVLGKTWHQAFPHAVGNAVDLMYQRVMATRTPERMEFFYEHYGRWLEICASPVKPGGVAVYFRDISQRKNAEEALREETRTLETLQKVGRTVAAELDLERVVQAVTDAATELSGAAFGSFFYNVKNEAGESYMLYTLSGIPREAFAGFPMPRNTALFEPTFAGQGVVRCDDVTKDARYGKTAPHYGMPEGHLPVRSYLAVPVVSRTGEVLGGLFFGHPEPGTFTARAERMVTTIASHAAVGIDNARLYRDLMVTKDKLARQVTELQRTHELATRLAAIVESSDDAVISTALDGTIQSWNSGAQRLYGYTACEVIGRPLGLIIPPELGDEERLILERLSRGERVQHFDTVRVAKDGRRIDVSVTVSPLCDASGKLVGASRIGRDIGARKAAEDALREADRRKDVFLATLAHELRNPLAPISNGLHLLRYAGPDAAVAEQTRAMMERQVKHLVRLVDDLLDVSRITRGKVELRKERIRLADAIVAAAETSRPLMQAAGHTLDLAPPGENIVLEADMVRISQVIANILNNAAKYTDNGGRISLGVRRLGAEAVITVRDNGVGIPAEMLPRVFDLFSQVDRTLNRAQGGLGIGLTLAKALVELHGGRIEAHSAGPGQGAQFDIYLPVLAAGSAPAQADRSPAVPRTRAARRRILVVDDNVDAARSLGMMFSRMGHEVQVAHDGFAALEAGREWPPDLVVLDISMPGVDGFEVVRRLRKDPKLARSRFVALTGHGQEAFRQRSREAGFDEYLVKPLTPELLHCLLAEHGLP